MMTFQCFIFTIFLLWISTKSISGQEWGYGTGVLGADNWSNNFDKCGGLSQSPVDLVATRQTIINFSPFIFQNYEEDITGTLVHKGKTVQFDLPENPKLLVSAGGLSKEYRLLQFHFHWGSSSTGDGSEHAINNDFFPLEVHLVHINTEYATVADALEHTDGLAVLGIMFKEAENSNPSIEPVTDALGAILEPEQNIDITLEKMMHLLPGDRSKFYRYSGSLTTPTCDEAVVWTVFEDPLPIGRDQLLQFYQLTEDSTSLINNFRPLQALNGRDISFYDGKVTGSPDEIVTLPQVVRDPEEYCRRCMDKRNQLDYYANPFDCTTYYHCYMNGTRITAVLRPCPPGTGFDENRIACVWDPPTCKVSGSGKPFIRRPPIISDDNMTCFDPDTNSTRQVETDPMKFTVFWQFRNATKSCPLGSLFNVLTCDCSIHKAPSEVKEDKNKCILILYISGGKDIRDSSFVKHYVDNLGKWKVKVGIIGFPNNEEAMAFPGDTDLELPGFQYMPIGDSITIKFWIFPEDCTRDEGLMGNCHLTDPDTTITGKPSIHIWKQQNVIFAGFRTEWEDKIDSLQSAPLVCNEWHQISLVYSGRSISLYVDGALQQTTTFKYSSEPILKTKCPFNIGSAQGKSKFIGMMDLVSICRGGRSAAEVLTLYDQEKILFGL